jgi:hypothetical protein
MAETAACAGLPVVAAPVVFYSNFAQNPAKLDYYAAAFGQKVFVIVAIQYCLIAFAAVVVASPD